jgi:hypothetical protein
MDLDNLSPRELREAALAAMALEVEQEELDRARSIDTQMSDSERKANANRVREATSTTLHWLQNYTKTFNPHWKDDKLESPYLPFPDWPFFSPLLEWLEDDEDGDARLIEKSRTMMVTWAIMGYFTLQCMRVPERQVVVQTMTEDKGEQPIDYAKCLWASQPDWLREAFPLEKPLKKQAANEFLFDNGSKIFLIPAGVGKIRSYHPWGYFSDETAFQADAGVAYDEALSAAKKIVLNSTAAPSWYFDFLSDAEMGDAS